MRFRVVVVFLMFTAQLFGAFELTPAVKQTYAQIYCLHLNDAERLLKRVEEESAQNAHKRGGKNQKRGHTQSPPPLGK